METKELKIQVPKGYKIDKENSTFDCIKFKPIKNTLTYDDIIQELFAEHFPYFKDTSKFSNLCTSDKQVKKLLAINQLMNIAKYLNGGDWSPNFEENTPKYYIVVDQHIKLIRIDYTCREIYSVVYFKNSDLAEQAIEIFGEENIRLALSTDW